MLGCKLYEQFDIVVRLITQAEATDCVWVDLLQRARHDECHEENLKTLHGLILTDAQYPQTLVFFLGARRSTDLDMANGARGHTVDIVLDEREEALEGRTHCRRLQYPSLYVLVSMNRTKASALDGLEQGWHH